MNYYECMSVVLKFFAIALCCFSSFVLIFQAAIITITAFATDNLNMQIYAFLLLAFILIAAFVGILFCKNSSAKKSIVIFLTFVFQCLFIKYSLFIPTVDKIINIHYCIDKGDVWDKVKNECIKNVYKVR